MSWFKKVWVKSYQNRIEKFDEEVLKLYERIESIKADKKGLEELMKIEANTFEEKICKLYIERGRIIDVVDWVNGLGLRIQTKSRLGERKYTSNDISDFYRNQRKDKDNVFSKEAYRLFKMNSCRE
jgi:hypothetical protein